MTEERSKIVSLVLAFKNHEVHWKSRLKSTKNLLQDLPVLLNNRLTIKLGGCVAKNDAKDDAKEDANFKDDFTDNATDDVRNELGMMPMMRLRMKLQMMLQVMI